MVGAGQGGAGSAIFAQEPPSLPISPSSSPGAHLPERPPPPPLQSPGRAASSGQARQTGPLRRHAACFDSLTPVQLACLLFRPGQEEKLEASTHLHHFLLFHVSPSQLLYISSSHSHYVSFKISILDYGTLILYALMSKYSLTTKWT